MPDAILIVDDEEHVLQALRRTLMDEDYQVVTAPGGDQALRLLEEQVFKVLICDERMPGMSGDELLSLVNLRYPATVRITLTGYVSIQAAMKAVNERQIFRFLVKPWNDIELKFAIRSAIEKYDLEMENRKLLALVRTQAFKLGALEKKNPGITRLKKSEDGSIALPELSDEDMARIMAECGMEYRKP